MKIEELSIGDWVFHLAERQAGRILHIHRIGGIYSIGLDCADCVVVCGINDVAPIAITPEILEKNGFKRKQYTIDIGQEIEYDGYRHILYQDGAQYDIVLVDSCGGYFDLEIESSYRNEDGDRILISSMLSLNYVEFVHQLQRALRLAGIEKEIEV